MLGQTVSTGMRLLFIQSANAWPASCVTVSTSPLVPLKFANENERERAYYDLIENDRVFEIDGIDRHISYIKGNNGLTLTINNF